MDLFTPPPCDIKPIKTATNFPSSEKVGGLVVLCAILISWNL